MKGYHKAGDHRCESICKKCKRANCGLDAAVLHCLHCKTQCNNKYCLKFHQENFCPVVNKCKVCMRPKSKHHVCSDDERYCSVCKLIVKMNEHKCFIQIEDRKKEESSKPKGFIFFDYECLVDDYKNHIPNLVMARKVYLDKNDIAKYTLDPIKYTFNSNAAFCKWLLNKNHSNFTAIAHNMKGYDGSFIMQYMLKNLKSVDRLPKVLVNGTKTLSIDHRKIKIIDSYSFLPMALEKFSSTFSITELKKGFFPHRFNKVSNFNYDGAWPAASEYGSEFFSKQKKRRI